MSVNGTCYEDKKLLSVNEVCDYLGLGATKVRELLNDPTSTYTVRIGSRLMANKTMLDDYLDRVAKYRINI